MYFSIIARPIGWFIFIRSFLSLTSHKIKSRLQRTNQRHSRLRHCESFGNIVEKDTEAKNDAIHEEVAHEGGCDDHPTPSTIRWHHHLHLDALSTPTTKSFHVHENVFLPEVSWFPWNFPSITILIGKQRRAKTRCRIGFPFLAARFSLGRRFKFPRYFHGPTKNIWQFVKTRRRFGSWRQERSCGSVDGQRRTFQHRHSWKFTRCSRSRLKNVLNRPSRRLSRFARPRVTQNSDVLSNRRPRPRPRHVTLIPIHFNRELDLWITTASIFSLVQRYRRRLLLISLQSIGAAPRFASFATVPASLELFSRARCTEADRPSRENEYVNRRITLANFKYHITRSLPFRARIFFKLLPY